MTVMPVSYCRAAIYGHMAVSIGKWCGFLRVCCPYHYLKRFESHYDDYLKKYASIENE